MTEASQRDNDAVASVKQVIHVLAEAWNRKDPDAFAALFTDDGEWTDVLANPVQGHEAVRNLHVFPFTTAMKKAQLILNDIRIRLLKPDVASVDVTWQAIGQTTPDGSKEIPTRNGLMTLVLLQQAGDKCAIALGHHFDYTATYRRHWVIFWIFCFMLFVGLIRIHQNRVEIHIVLGWIILSRSKKSESLEGVVGSSNYSHIYLSFSCEWISAFASSVGNAYDRSLNVFFEGTCVSRSNE